MVKPRPESRGAQVTFGKGARLERSQAPRSAVVNHQTSSAFACYFACTVGMFSSLSAMSYSSRSCTPFTRGPRLDVSEQLDEMILNLHQPIAAGQGLRIVRVAQRLEGFLQGLAVGEGRRCARASGGKPH